jgi:hypothetical protein
VSKISSHDVHADAQDFPGLKAAHLAQGCFIVATG